MLSNIVDLISEIDEIYNSFFINFFHDKRRVIHFIGDAAKGKHIFLVILHTKE